jgi:hypothetical protein
MAKILIKILRCLAWPLLGLFLLPTTSLGHVLDEYLQATLATIEPGEVRLQINLTPGVAVAERVLRLIDHDRDGVISTNEATAYAKMLMNDLSFRLDQRKVELKLTSSNFPAPSELRTGDGIIQIEFSGIISPLSAGAHKLILKNRHLRTMSVYLFNAAQPRSDSIHVTKQKRNDSQSTGEIAFTID